MAIVVCEVGTAKPVVPSVQELLRRCEAGDANACFNLAYFHQWGAAEKVSCDGGVLGGESCYQPGLLYLTGGASPEKVRKDLARALALYE